MDRRQKRLLVNSITVLLVTTALVVGMMFVRGWLNRSEAIRGMEVLGEEIMEYHQREGALPPESYLAPLKSQLVRLGEFNYRAPWIDYDSGPDTILAYAKKELGSGLLSSGYVVLRLDGRVEWMGEEEFEKLLHRQQGEQEIKILRERMGQAY